jgi:hypothetical protein
MDKKYEVRIGIGRHPKKMSYAAALRYADAMMPPDLRRAGFVASVFKTSFEIHGGEWLRINYSK